MAQFNDYDVRVAKFLGECIWQTHDNTDETFLVLDGELTFELREAGEHRTVTLPKGWLYVVPRGVEHKPVASAGASIMMIEPTGTVNVGRQPRGDPRAYRGHDRAPRLTEAPVAGQPAGTRSGG